MEELIDKRFKNSKQGFTSLLGLLVAITVICILAFTVFSFYFKKPMLDKTSEKLLQEQNFNTSSYQSILSDVKGKLKDATQKEADRTREVEDVK